MFSFYMEVNLDNAQKPVGIQHMHFPTFAHLDFKVLFHFSSVLFYPVSGVTTLRAIYLH